MLHLLKNCATSWVSSFIDDMVPMSVITRFAPSPTGFLHIGGARTALFSWLFARRHGGKFLLRIEDTDRARSTQAAVEAILDGLSWLGLNWDDEVIFQFSRASRHAEVAHKLLAEGKAYKCYCTPAELEAMREQAKAEGRPIRYDGRWRDRPESEAPVGVLPVVRLKAPQGGETTVKDHVQGEVTVANEQLDDMVLLRGDGTPTYMLSVVVDDHDMNITHVVRGDDHFTNTFRQIQIYNACGWTPPEFAHIPLIHGPDGAKLSKRHGALGAEAYREMGFLPEAMRNYLLRLGWSHGDDEIISTEQAVEWFNLESIGSSPARFDVAKLTNLNGHYIRHADDARLAELAGGFLAQRLGRALTDNEKTRIRLGMPSMKERAKTLVELADSAFVYAASRPLVRDEKAEKQLDAAGREILSSYAAKAAQLSQWERGNLEEIARNLAEEKAVKLGQVAQPLRAALTGSTVSPPIFEVMEILGREETLARITDVISS
jgi:glutamyl-tRNA synthetase